MCYHAPLTSSEIDSDTRKNIFAMCLYECAWSSDSVATYAGLWKMVGKRAYADTQRKSTWISQENTLKYLKKKMTDVSNF